MDKQKKGEDWEHEDERADDDVDMGEEGEDADATSTPPKSASHLTALAFLSFMHTDTNHPPQQVHLWQQCLAGQAGALSPIEGFFFYARGVSFLKDVLLCKRGVA